MSPNSGRRPPEAIGKRVRVLLRNGSRHGHLPVNADSKLGWAADTTNWQLTGSDFDVVSWELAT